MPRPDGATRRDFLRGAGAVGAAGLAGGLLGAPVRAARAAPGVSPPRVVVVGAGLAGLTAAYRLRQAGIDAQVHEAASRLGGRCWTIRGVFDEGQIGEHGGELIDTGHLEIKHLAQELGLDLDNLVAAQQNGTEDLYWFDDGPYTYAQATDDIKKIWQQVHSDLSAASYPTTYYSSTQRGRELDNMSDRGLDRSLRARRARLAARPAARRRLQHRVRRRVQRSRAR